MRGQGSPGLDPADRIDDTGRENLIREFHEAQHRQWRLLAGLDDDRVPHGQRGCALLGEVDRRPVEGKDRCHHAVRFVIDAGLDRALVEDLTVDGVGDSRVVVEAGVTGHDVNSPSVPHGLADLTGDQLGEFVGVFADDRRDLPQQVSPLLRREVAPGFFIGTPGVLHRTVDGVRVGSHQIGESSPRRCLQHRDGGRGGVVDEGSTDEGTPDWPVTQQLVRHVGRGHGSGCRRGHGRTPDRSGVRPVWIG